MLDTMKTLHAASDHQESMSSERPVWQQRLLLVIMHTLKFVRFVDPSWPLTECFRLMLMSAVCNACAGNILFVAHTVNQSSIHALSAHAGLPWHYASSVIKNVHLVQDMH